MSGPLGDLFSPTPTPETPAPTAVAVPVGGPAVALFGQGSGNFIGMEGLSPEALGLRAPRLKIVNAIRDAEETGRPGDFRIGKTAITNPKVVFLRPAPYRALIEGEGKDSRTVCASEDCKVPHDGVENPKDVNCGSCAYAQWDEDPATGKRKPPKCGLGHAWIGVMPEANDGPIIFTATGRYGVQASQDFAQSARITPGALGFFQFLVKMATKRMENGGIIWYAPVFGAELRPPAEMEKYRQMALSVENFRYRAPITANQEGKPVTTNGAVDGTIPASALTDGIPF